MDFIHGLPRFGSYDSCLVVTSGLSRFTRVFPCNKKITGEQCKCSADLSCKHFDSFSGYSLIGRRGFWSLSLYAHYLEYLIMKSNNEIQYRKSDKANT